MLWHALHTGVSTAWNRLIVLIDQGRRFYYDHLVTQVHTL